MRILKIFFRDSGGPLVIDGKVAGVLSWRLRNCGDGTPGWLDKTIWIF